jgi:putative zinc finger protein
MKPLTCTATRRRLQAFHDRELTVTDQIAVSAHLEWCDQCAAALADLRALGAALQAFAPGRAAVAVDESGSFPSAVLNRMKAERDVSFLVRVRAMFDDMHLVYSGLGAAAATMVCVVIMLSMMRFATDERPDSLAAIMSVLSTSLGCDSVTDLIDGGGCSRWEAQFQRANESAEQDAVFALDAVVIDKGRLADLEHLRARKSRRADADQVEIIEGLLDSVNRARIEGQTSQLAVTGNMLRVIERATVRANANKPLDLQLPPGKKRARTNAALHVLAFVLHI